MIIVDLLLWWYGAGWLQEFRRIGQRTGKIAEAFAIPTLVSTLFSPWRRIVSAGGKGMDGKLQAMLDNLVSRSIGFVVRIMVLLVAILLLGGSLLVGVVTALVWPLVPLAFVYSLVRGFTS